MVCRVGVRSVVLLAAAALLASCERATLDKTPPMEGSIGLDGGVLGSGSRPGGTAGSGRGAGSSGGDTMPVIPACVVPSRVPQAWTEVAAPDELAGFQITDAWAAPGRDDFFFAAMGLAKGNPPRTTARIGRWTGGCWSVELSWPTFSRPPSLSGSATDDLWATTGDALLHRDATGWSRADGELGPMLTAQNGGVAPPFDFVRGGGASVWVTAGHFVCGPRTAVPGGCDQITTDGILGSARDPSATFRFTKLYYDWQGVAVGGAVDLAGGLLKAAFVGRYGVDTRAWTLGPVGLGAVSSFYSGPGTGLWVGATSGGGNPSLLRVDPATPGTGGSSGASGASSWAVAPISIDGWPAGTESQALWGLDGADVWAAAGGDLAHWDGASWKAIPGPPAAGAGATMLTGDGGSLWFVTDGPRFFRIAH